MTPHPSTERARASRPGHAGHAPSSGAFYASPRGRMVANVIGARLAAIWPDLGRMSVLGLGYPTPYLKLWSSQAYRCLGAVSEHHAAPREGGVCAVEATRLPFPDLSFDRVLVVHGVEPSGQDDRLLREIWRVLKDDGRMLVVAPNRIGLWAHVETTPFGQGQPYSQSQINRRLTGAMFRPERHEAALFTPPATSRLILKTQAIWEKAGRALLPNLAGVLITEAVKDAYAAMPVHAPSRRVVLQEAA